MFFSFNSGFVEIVENVSVSQSETTDSPSLQLTSFLITLNGLNININT